MEAALKLVKPHCFLLPLPWLRGTRAQEYLHCAVCVGCVGWSLGTIDRVGFSSFLALVPGKEPARMLVA